ncbi:MAG: hypothetical protein JWM68_5364 [Verrucomicrobiales bacterium]|nr:hypothetical protein [Verrucomicrobiales bacterium]
MKKHLLIAIALFPLVSFAQTYSIDWSKISGGGGTSTNGVYSLSGTIGQHDAGTMSGGNFTLDGGFWSIGSVVQTPGSPKLTLTVVASNYVLSWPVSSATFRIESNSNLANAAGWGTAPQTAVTNGGTVSVSIPIATAFGNKFYRLNTP